MGSAGTFEWQGQEGRSVSFLFMCLMLPFACVCSVWLVVSEKRQPSRACLVQTPHPHHNVQQGRPLSRGQLSMLDGQE
jgi:hypothetical protein